MKLDQTFRRLYTIPDIHGALSLLNRALELMYEDGYEPGQDALIFLGDLIDRGPDSNGVLDLVISLKAAHLESVFVLKGNHEEFPLDTYVRKKSFAMDFWLYNGGGATLGSYPTRQMSDDHLRFLGGLPYWIEAQGFFFSHAPVPREKLRTGRCGFDGSVYGTKGQAYNPWELTWYYFGPEGEKPGGLMDCHEGPLSDCGTGSDHLIGVCGHIHRGRGVTEARIFRRYRILDCGAGCYSTSPLAVHECVSGRTLYAWPMDAG